MFYIIFRRKEMNDFFAPEDDVEHWNRLSNLSFSPPTNLYLSKAETKIFYLINIEGT